MLLCQAPHLAIWYTDGPWPNGEVPLKRRDFISAIALAAIVCPRVLSAQTSSKVFRLGTLIPGPPLDDKSALGAILLKELDRRGYTLGKNLALDARGAAGDVTSWRDRPRHEGVSSRCDRGDRLSDDTSLQS